MKKVICVAALLVVGTVNAENLHTRYTTSLKLGLGGSGYSAKVDGDKYTSDRSLSALVGLETKNEYGQGFEFGVINFGKASVRNTDLDIQATGLYLGPVVSFPMAEKLTADVRLGLLSWKGELTYGGETVDSDRGFDLYYGAGLSYQFSKEVTGSVDWTRYKFDDVRANTMMVNVKYAF